MPESTIADHRPRAELAAHARLRSPAPSWYVPPRGATALICGVLGLIATGAAVVADLDDGPSSGVSHALAAPDSSPGSMFAVVDQIGARDLWQAGITGAGVNVAVIDTGVANVPALADQVVATVDFSADANQPTRAFVDGHGHGTHMAGIVAGRTPGADPATSAAHPDWFMGVAPGAGIVSVKVGDSAGSVAPNSLLAGIDWVAQNAERLDIGVAVLAFDASAGQSYLDDPIAAAVERAWANDVVVVAAAGNGGPDAVGLSSPATDPYVIAVAGVDLTGDHPAIPDWASRGTDDRRPDLSAPGAHIKSLRAPGSNADVDHASGYVDDQRFLNSGSSPAAAAIGGVAALVRSADPTLTADQVKAKLVDGASALGLDPAFTGAGLVDAAASVASTATGNVQDWPTSTSTILSSPLTPYSFAWMGNSWMGNSWMGNSWM